MVRRGRRFESVRGLEEEPCKWACCVACVGEISILRGYETGTFWDWRACAGTLDILRHSPERARDSRPRPLARKVPANRVWCCPCWREADHLVRYEGVTRCVLAAPGRKATLGVRTPLGRASSIRGTSCPPVPLANPSSSPSAVLGDFEDNHVGVVAVSEVERGRASCDCGARQVL
jgi:hypothetical protein